MTKNPEREFEVRIPIRVTPRAGRDSIDGVRDGALAVRVAAPPADGAANIAVTQLIAGMLGIAPRGSASSPGSPRAER